MLIISSREFRDHQKKYFDLVDQNEQVIVQRGKNKAYILAPIGDADKLSVNEQLIEYVREADLEYSCQVNNNHLNQMHKNIHTVRQSSWIPHIVSTVPF